jgi:hypothetical protein
MADKDNFTEAKLFHYGNNILSECGHRPRLSVQSGPAMAGKVDRHNRVFPRKRIPLLFPILEVTGPAMDKNESRYPFPLNLIMDGNTISRRDIVMSDARHL